MKTKNTKSALTIQEQLAQLEEQRKSLLALEAEAVKARDEKISEAVRGFIPSLQKLGAQLGENDFKGMIALIRHVENGTLGKLSVTVGTRKERVVLTDAQKAEAIEKMKNGVQMSKIAADYNISDATAFALKKQAGLVEERKGSTAPAPSAA